jgi:hypothetical protein
MMKAKVIGAGFMIGNEISGLVVDLCVKIHKQYGRGF